MTKLADLIWKNAELLRGAFKENEYRKVILPFTILRRLDCVLEPTRPAVQAKYAVYKYKSLDLDRVLVTASGYPFFNTSAYTLPMLAQSPDDVRDNLEHMLNGFSQNVRDIFEKFGFAATLDKLAEKNRLYLVVQRFAETPMRLQDVSNHDMGQAFEELLRKFNDVSPAGEQYTPRDVIELMVNILFDGDSEVLSVPGVVRTVYDPTAGTGGMLSVADEHLRRFNDRAVLKLFGQELEDETYAICKADMLIRGQDPANIANGDTLVIDKHPQQSFEYMLSNPPYGVEWKPAEAAVRKEHSLGAKGRYAPGLPAIRDGQMLFSLHLLSKMQAFKNGKGGSRIAVVHNGSPLFTGDAGGGESEIRRYILENDYLDCIVAMPTDLFYNTNITTYLWFMSNRKLPERQGKVLLLDASGMAVLLKKNLGKKRREFTADCMARITRAYHEHTTLDWTEPKADGDTSPARKLKAKLLPKEHFFYRKLTIERPLRQRFDITADTLAALQADAAYAKLPPAQASALLASLQALLDKRSKGLKGSKSSKSSKPDADADAVPPSYASADLFRAALNTTSQQAPINELLKHKTLELARKACGTRDASAQPTTNEKGDVLTDAELRDAEYVPYGEDVRAYFAKQVLPHWPDAWINEVVIDAKDGKLGMVGTEINFNREFYQYTPPRSKQAIQHEIERMEQQFMALLKEVTTAAQGTA